VQCLHSYAHRLSLVLGKAASAELTNSQKFFGIIQETYNFMCGSSNHYSKFKYFQENYGTSKITLKKLCSTRWSARNEAVKAIHDNYFVVLLTLNHYLLNKKDGKEAQKLKTKITANE
jgi:hypothetical protein